MLALAVAAGSGAAWAWSEGWPMRHALARHGALFLAGTIVSAFHHWWNALG
jgi:hypothetical protein